ncbi:uncharacterized protein LTR77_011246 [Saxophila tyrrhenica]|uniref:Uncharacterized protein n=1 Tax=Saxophila tyrrhenica TaxID=1690608 RepID=A0AAV9NVN8_9PEZI|nr:hypothetical protein LTR77_011246 [Saxophila tyrrhenica]
MKTVFSFMIKFSVLFLIISRLVCATQVLNPALSVMLLYCENAEELPHPGWEQCTNSNGVLFVDSFRFTIGPLDKALTLGLGLDLYLHSELGSLAGLFLLFLLLLLLFSLIIQFEVDLVVGHARDRVHLQCVGVCAKHSHNDSVPLVRIRIMVDYCVPVCNESVHRHALIWYTGTMSDNNVIDGLIGLKVEDDDSDVSIHGDGAEVQLDNTDRNTEMAENVRAMKMMMETMMKRMDRLESEMKVVKASSHKSKTRDAFAMPNPDAHRHTASPIFRSRDSEVSVAQDDDTESFTNVSRTRSEAERPNPDRTTSSYMTKVMSPSVFLGSGGNKSRSALSNRGYSNKAEVWGVCFASLMHACINKYIQFRGEVGHVIDGIVIMRTYSNIVELLYNKIKSSDLPAVQASSSNFMATSFSRSNSNSLPESTARDWFDLSQHPDGAECMSVIQSVFQGAKLVPEAMVHPISQLIPQMLSPVIRKTPNGPTFSIVSTAKVSMSPTGHENFCKYLKMSALKTYVRYRLDGASEDDSILAMSRTLKDTEMFDGKNLHRGREIISGASGF